jgi:hypothetical protein
MKNVLVPMRRIPLAWTTGRVVRWLDARRVEVSMPYKNRNLFQVFDKEEIIFIS